MGKVIFTKEASNKKAFGDLKKFPSQKLEEVRNCFPDATKLNLNIKQLRASLRHRYPGIHHGQGRIVGSDETRLPQS